MFRTEVQSTKARPPVTWVSSRTARAAAATNPGWFGIGEPGRRHQRGLACVVEGAGKIRSSTVSSGRSPTWRRK